MQRDEELDQFDLDGEPRPQQDDRRKFKQKDGKQTGDWQKPFRQ